ncbi:predicted protein [Nematostella vectensis]|uniref:Uncharacterized protein n=1 Tax=Nematostella vectensis TaxID=45351 RepID=A7RHQ9_NEMVE|nr:predicted protein [Nematostella vectensis]|eukprot:XP_001641083.1 predicted protein [Nematostella vectensis]
MAARYSREEVLALVLDDSDPEYNEDYDNPTTTKTGKNSRRFCLSIFFYFQGQEGRNSAFSYTIPVSQTYLFSYTIPLSQTYSSPYTIPLSQTYSFSYTISLSRTVILLYDSNITDSSFLYTIPLSRTIHSRIRFH